MNWSKELKPLLTLSIQTETSELLEQAFSYLFLYSFLYLSFFIDSTIGFSYKHFRIRIKHNHFLFDHFLSSSSYYFDLGSTLWNWIAVLGTYSIFAFSFSFSSSLYSWQSCCYVPFYLFDINRFLLSINNELRFKELPKFLEGVNFYFQYWIYFFYFPSFLIEFSMSFFLVSYYWHFVDWIWFLVFLFFLLFNVPNMISLLEFYCFDLLLKVYVSSSDCLSFLGIIDRILLVCMVLLYLCSFFFVLFFSFIMLLILFIIYLSIMVYF